MSGLPQPPHTILHYDLLPTVKFMAMILRLIPFYFLKFHFYLLNRKVFQCESRFVR